MIWLINPITLLLVYIAYAYLYAARLKRKWLTVIYYPVLVIGALLDVIVNVTYGTLVFWDLPKEWLLTKRVERLKSEPGYRGTLANLICKLLNHFQVGHCG